MKIPVLKDGDGDYWLPYGAEGQDRICLTREGKVDGSAGPISPDRLAVSEFGPFIAIEIEVKELPDPALTCDACLRDLHFCYQCDDAVSHGHRHEEGLMAGTTSSFDSAQWAAHLAAQKAAERRVTPILEKQAKNDPNRK